MLSLCPEPPCTVPRQPSLAFSLPPSSRQVLTGPELSFPEPGGQEALWRLDSDPAGWGELPLTSPGDSLFFCTGSGGISWDLTAPLFALGEESKFPNVPEELGAKAQEKCGWGTVGMSLPLPNSLPVSPRPHQPHHIPGELGTRLTGLIEFLRPPRVACIFH